MKFTISADILSSAVAYAAKAIPKSPAKPIFAGLVLRAHDGFVTILGMDPSVPVSLQARVPATITTEGEALVHGKMFAGVSASLKGDVEVWIDGPRVYVVAGKAKFALPRMPMEDYPVPMPDADVISGTVATADLVEAAEQVAFAADADGGVPLLGGVRVEFNGKHVTFAATDRYRLAARELTWDSLMKAPVALTVPAKQFSEAVRGLGKDGDTVTVSLVNSDQVSLSGETRTAKLGTIEGDYPQWRSLLPKQYAGTATVKAKDALETLNRVAIVGERNDPVALSFTSELLAFQVGRDDSSGGQDEVKSTHSGQEMTVLFNPAYLRDGLAACGSSNVALQLLSPAKPMVLTPEGCPGYTYLVMSIRPPV